MSIVSLNERSMNMAVAVTHRRRFETIGGQAGAFNRE
jgi:hypothetical protein